MSAEDFEVFNIIRKERQERRNKRLNETSDKGWSKHADTHWYLIIDGVKLDYWPSANKWQFKGRYYRGSIPRWLYDTIQEKLASEN